MGPWGLSGARAPLPAPSRQELRRLVSELERYQDLLLPLTNGGPYAAAGVALAVDRLKQLLEGGS